MAKSRKIPLCIGFFCLVLFLIKHNNPTPFFYSLADRVDGHLYDYLVSLNLYPRKPIPPIAIVDIDDYSVQREGRWPWPRDRLATLVSNLYKLGADVVAFDIVFAQSEQNIADHLRERIEKLSPTTATNLGEKLFPLLDQIAPEVDNDQLFARTMKGTDTILGYLFSPNSGQTGALPSPLINKPTPFQLHVFQGYNGILPLFLEAAAGAGFVSNPPDSDGVLRHGLLLGRFQGEVYSSFALTIVMQHLGIKQIGLISNKNTQRPLLKGIQLGDQFIPTNDKGQMLIPFWEEAGSIDYYSASDVIQGKLDKGTFDNAIVIIGSTMVLLSDLHQSPTSQTFPGVELNANMIASILSNQVPREFYWDRTMGNVILAAVGLFLVALFPFCGAFVLIIFSLFLIAMLLESTLYLFSYSYFYLAPSNLIILITLLALMNFIYASLLERRQKKQIKQLFGQYVPEAYVQKIVEFPESYHQEEETRDMTVFFADIRNFTTLSEKLDASEVKRLLNSFFTPITDIIFKHKGTVDKYVGDMIMAFWGAPLEDKEHVANAIAALLEIKNNLDRINQNLVDMDLPSIVIGMGIATGLMNVGDMGSKFRRAYTVLGDTVNLASRLQDVTKFYQVSILASDTTRQDQNRFIWRPIDKILTKGRQKPLTIYEPLGYLQDASPALLNELKTHELAWNAYYKRNWELAKTYFQQLQAQSPSTKLYRIFLERIESFIKEPPPADWDGVFVHELKYK